MTGITRLKPALLLTFGVMVLACGQWRRVGTEDVADPGEFVPRVFEPTEAYRGMNLLAAEGPIPFVGGIRFLAGPTPDSTLGLFGLSFADTRLTYGQVGNVFEARYQVQLTFTREAEVVLHSTQEHTVRLSTYAETRRGEGTQVYQQFVRIPPGSMSLEVTVRDERAGTVSQAEMPITVPAYGTEPELSALVPVHQAAVRVDRTALPEMVLNPRAAAPYGMEMLRIYLEAYGLPEGERVIFRAVPREDPRAEPWRDSVAVSAGSDLTGFVLTVETATLPLGELDVEAFIPGTGDTVRTAVLVTFSEQWAIAHFEETLSLLRYFGAEGAIREMRQAAPDDRLRLWREFWTATDPDPMTPGHEGLDLYFQRVREANARFRERDTPGWLTDRGEVFVTIGAPDEIWDSSSDLEGVGRYIRWTYISARTALTFVDETGFGQFRLTSLSRSEFMRVVNRMRRSG